MPRHLITILIAALFPIALAWAGVSLKLGAHPFWDVKTALIGAPIGALVGMLVSMKLPRTASVLIFAILTFAAYAVAHWGKSTFAASYAEDALAGKVWFFGWIATSGAFAALIAAILAKRG